MALSIKNREFEATARELARLTGKSITEAALVGLKRELERQKSIKRMLNRHEEKDIMAGVRDVQQRYAARATTSALTDEEILGYDDFGAPTK